MNKINFLFIVKLFPLQNRDISLSKICPALNNAGKTFFLNLIWLTLLLGTSASSFSQSQPRYNVLFIPVDDMNDRVSFLGWPEVVTPNLQRLLSRGMLFTRAYVQYAICNPSRTSFLSGWRPDRTGIFNNATRPRSVISPSVNFLPEYFRQNGYRTERYGKIMHGLFENDITWDYAEPPERVFADTVKPDGPGIWWVKNRADSEQIDGTLSGDLIERLKQPQTQPFFYALGFYAPHSPFTPTLNDWNMIGDLLVQELLPLDSAGNTGMGFKGNGSSNIVIPNEPADDRSDIPSIAFNNVSQLIKPPDELKRTIHAYDADVILMDIQLGRVLDEIDRQNLWSNTIVVFFGDHGQHLGEHQGLWKKETLFEESLHIPLIVCVPGKPAGVCNRLVELIDIYPTLIELCGLPPVPGIEASSFARLLDNPDQAWKNAVFSQVRRDTIMARSVTTKRYRYNSWGSAGGELYDHNNDPKEYTNQVNNPAYAAVVTNMKQILADGWAKAIPPPVDTLTYYKDNDHDGYGSAADSVRSWYQPIGYVANKNDCDDSDAALSPPARPKKISGSLYNLCGGDDYIYSIPGVLGATSYIWTVPPAFSVLQNNGKSAVIRVPASFIKEKISVAANNACGSSEVRSITVYSIIPKAINGPSSASANQSNVTYKLPDVNGVTCNWVVPSGSTITSGQGTHEIAVKFGTSSGNVTVVASNNCGSIRAKKVVTVNAAFASGEESLLVQEKRHALRVYPNPARSVVNISFNSKVSATKYDLIIADMNGKQVYAKRGIAVGGENVIQVNTSSFANAMYFVKLITGAGTQIIKMHKEK